MSMTFLSVYYHTLLMELSSNLRGKEIRHEFGNYEVLGNKRQ